MDIQFRNGLLHGEPRLRVMAFSAIILQAITNFTEHLLRYIQESAPACECGMGRALSCGDCYDRLDAFRARKKQHIIGDILN